MLVRPSSSRARAWHSSAKRRRPAPAHPGRSDPQGLEELQQPLRRPEIGPGQRRQRRHREKRQPGLQDRLGEVVAGEGRVGLLERPRLAPRAKERRRRRETTVKPGQEHVGDGHERARLRDHDEGVPEPFPGQTHGSRLRRRLLAEAGHAADRAGRRGTDGVPRLDPAVLGVGLHGARAEEDDPVALAVDERDHLGHVGHECRPLEHEVIGGIDDDGGVGIPRRDPVDGQQDARRGIPVLRLQQQREPAVSAELRREPAGVMLLAHHDRPLPRAEPCRSRQGLAEQRVAADQRHVLFRAIVSHDRARHGAEPHPLTAREHDRPRTRRAVIHGTPSHSASSTAGI